MIKNILLKLLMAAGLFLIINSMVMVLISNFNLGIIATFVFGLALLCYGAYNKQINKITSKGIMKWIKYALYAGTLFMMSVIILIAVVGNIDTATFEEDAVIILGAGIRGDRVTLPLAYRLDKGIEYISKNPNAVIVVTGGQGPQESITEALAMEKYLISRGVPKNKIIKEEKATSTYENFQFSKLLLDNYFQKPYKVTYITNDFHIYRAGQLAKIAGIDATSYGAEIQWYVVPTTYLREFLAVLKLWVFKN